MRALAQALHIHTNEVNSSHRTCKRLLISISYVNTNQIYLMPGESGVTVYSAPVKGGGGGGIDY